MASTRAKPIQVIGVTLSAADGLRATDEMKAAKICPMPMPAQPGLSDADAKTRAAWVLGGAK